MPCWSSAPFLGAPQGPRAQALEALPSSHDGPDARGTTPFLPEVPPSTTLLHEPPAQPGPLVHPRLSYTDRAPPLRSRISIRLTLPREQMLIIQHQASL